MEASIPRIYQETMENVAVVILNWNGEKFLRRFLPSVVEYSLKARVVVADNGSTDSSLEVIRDLFPTVEVVELSSNYGFAEGYNRALEVLRERYANSIEYYVLLNSDVEVTAGWITPIVELFKQDQTTAAIQPKILAEVKRTHFEYAGASGGFIDSLGFPFCRGRLINNCEEDRGQYDDIREIFWASGAALAIRSDVYHSLGGFDSSFFAHMEEIDLCWRIKRAGYSIKVCPQSVVFHLGAGTLPIWSPRKTYLNFRNNFAMLYKNLSKRRFAAIYCVRIGTDLLRALSYCLTGKWSFASAIIRGHRDFWRTRKSYNRSSELPTRGISQIYRGSIVLYYLFKSKEFKNIL